VKKTHWQTSEFSKPATINVKFRFSEKNYTLLHLGFLPEVMKTASFDEKIVVLADKLSNIRAIYRDFSAIGDGVWELFNEKDKAAQEWYYRAIAENLRELSSYIAYKEYCWLVEAVFSADSSFAANHHNT
jgi:hypothetical protein